MTEQLETIPKEEKAEKEARRPSLEKHRKEKPFKTGRGRISTPERKIAKKEPSTVSRDEVRRKKGSFNNHFFKHVCEVIRYYSFFIEETSNSGNYFMKFCSVLLQVFIFS